MPQSTGGGSGASGGTPAVVLSTAAAAGVASTFLRTDDQLIAFDATVPVTQASADAAATGSAAVAARRDHKHGMPTLASSFAPIWVQPHYVTGTGATLAGNLGYRGVSSFADSSAVQGAYFTTVMPTGMTSVTKAVVIVVGDNNLRWLVNTHFGATGEAYNANVDSVTEATTALTNLQTRELDVSTALTGIAAGDSLGLLFERQGDDVLDTCTTLSVVGLLIEYS